MWVTLYLHKPTWAGESYTRRAAAPGHDRVSLAGFRWFWQSISSTQLMSLKKPWPRRVRGLLFEAKHRGLDSSDRCGSWSAGHSMFVDDVDGKDILHSIPDALNLWPSHPKENCLGSAGGSALFRSRTWLHLALLNTPAPGSSLKWSRREVDLDLVLVYVAKARGRKNAHLEVLMAC